MSSEAKLYKIRITCTSKDELSFNNKRVSKDNFRQLKDIKFPEYIYRANIVTRNIIGIKLTTKALEFICNRQVEEDEFKLFITFLKQIGFATKQDNKISYIKVDHNEYIYEYKINSLTKIVKEYGYVRNPLNKSIYQQISIRF